MGITSGIQCTELICNITVIDLHLTYRLLLHYLEKQSQVHNDDFQSYQPKLHITVTQSKTTSSLAAQPVQVQVFKMSSFSPRHASMVGLYAVVMRMFVRPSHAGIVRKRLNIVYANSATR